jgi:hypothetical protein
MLDLACVDDAVVVGQRSLPAMRLLGTQGEDKKMDGGPSASTLSLAWRDAGMNVRYARHSEAFRRG